MGEDLHAQQDDDPQNREETNGGTNTEDTLKGRTSYWVYKECKKLGVKNRLGKRKARKSFSFPTRRERLTEPNRKPTKKSLGTPP